MKSVSQKEKILREHLLLRDPATGTLYEFLINQPKGKRDNSTYITDTTNKSVTTLRFDACFATQKDLSVVLEGDVFLCFSNCYHYATTNSLRCYWNNEFLPNKYFYDRKRVTSLSK